MKTLVRPTALQSFIALCLGIVCLALAACQSITIAPVSQSESVHFAQPINKLDSLNHRLPVDSVAIDPQPRFQPTDF